MLELDPINQFAPDPLDAFYQSSSVNTDPHRLFVRARDWRRRIPHARIKRPLAHFPKEHTNNMSTVLVVKEECSLAKVRLQELDEVGRGIELERDFGAALLLLVYGELQKLGCRVQGLMVPR